VSAKVPDIVIEVANGTSSAGIWICALPGVFCGAGVQAESKQSNRRRTIPRSAALITDHPQSNSTAKFIAFTKSALGDKG